MEPEEVEMIIGRDFGERSNLVVDWPQFTTVGRPEDS